MLPLALSTPPATSTGYLIGDRAAVGFNSAAVAVIAHDFNNLLTTILGNLSLALFNPKLDNSTQERLVTAKKASLRAQELTNQLLMLGAENADHLEEDQPPSEDQMPVEAAPSAARTPRILVLDDEEAICTLVSCALEPLGYEVVETHDALTAIACYTDALQTGRRFDVVISDLTIPGGIGGQEAVRRLRTIDPALRAIVSTGSPCDPALSHSREHGFCAVIRKPYEIDTLGRTVAEVLASSTAPGLNVVEEEFASCATA